MTPVETLHALHRGPGVLVLANAWDALSARIVQDAGGRAVATSSAAVAWAHGRADGHELPFATLLTAAREIARVLTVPLSVDFEGGYSAEPSAVAENAAQLADAGAVGINLEDGTGSPDLLVEKISAVRSRTRLFINARVDVYLHKLTPPEKALDETLARMRRYADAGADGLFVPGPTDRAVIAELASATKLPLNVLARPGTPPLEELARLDVRRLSAGAGLARAVFQHAQERAAAFVKSGDSDALLRGASTHDFNAMFTSM